MAHGTDTDQQGSRQGANRRGNPARAEQRSPHARPAGAARMQHLRALRGVERFVDLVRKCDGPGRRQGGEVLQRRVHANGAAGQDTAPGQACHLTPELSRPARGEPGGAEAAKRARLERIVSTQL